MACASCIHATSVGAGHAAVGNFDKRVLGPLFEGGTDEALGLSIGAWSVRPGKAVFDAELLADPGE